MGQLLFSNLDNPFKVEMRRVETLLDFVLEEFVLTPHGEHSELDVALFVDEWLAN